MFGKEKPVTPAPSVAPTMTTSTTTASAAAAKIETVIGPNASFRGTMQSDGGVRIQGVFEGTIETTGNLVVDEGAKVIANITAHNVAISGAVKGDVSANRVEITKTGRVWGDLTVNSFLLDEGAFVRGQVNMHGGGEEPPLIEPPKKSGQIVDVVGSSSNGR
jgi:cytoskeletal protein CcmA (bactofilin family)